MQKSIAAVRVDSSLLASSRPRNDGMLLLNFRWTQPYSYCEHVYKITDSLCFETGPTIPATTVSTYSAITAYVLDSHFVGGNEM